MAKQGRRWAILFTGIVLGSLGTWLLASYHIIRTAAERVWIPRTTAGFTDTYVDVRGWTIDEWRRHPALLHSVVRAGRRDLLPTPPASPPLNWWGSPIPRPKAPPQRKIVSSSDRVST